MKEKIIIHSDGIDGAVACRSVAAVIDMGKISVDRSIATYCFHTSFHGGLHVSCRPNNENSFRFYVYREDPK